jgi:hypothetical protein
MKKPRPHNPDNLTKKQVGRAPWRLLDEDEIKPRGLTKAIQAWAHQDLIWRKLPSRGVANLLTYRTRLTRAQLRRLK